MTKEQIDQLSFVLRRLEKQLDKNGAKLRDPTSSCHDARRENQDAIRFSAREIRAALAVEMAKS